MIDKIKKFYYWFIIIGLIILGIAVYSMLARGSSLKYLFEQRPERTPGGKKQSIPEKPVIVDYIDAYRKKLAELK